MISYDFYEKNVDTLTCRIKGELSCPVSVLELGNIFRKAESYHQKTLDLDFGELKIINSAGIGKLFIENQKAKELGKKIQISSCSEPIYSILTIVNGKKYFQIDRL